jgi:hypothetical protein
LVTSPLYSITSSALSRIDGGTVSPSAIAVFRLMTIKYFVGNWTGSSDGFAALKGTCSGANSSPFSAARQSLGRSRRWRSRPTRYRRVGVLMGYDEADPEAKA